MAARSMVRTPPASASGGPAGDAFAGCKAGSWAVMGQVYGWLRPARPVWQSRTYRRPPPWTRGTVAGRGGCEFRARAGLYRFRHLILPCEIVEARHRGLELQIDGTGRTVALLADDDLGFAVCGIHLDLPLDVLVRARPRLLVAQVIFLAEHEQHDVGILLDRSRLAKIGQLRALVVAVLDLPRQLRQRHDRHVELLRQRLQIGRDLGDLLHAVFLGPPGRALQ